MPALLHRSKLPRPDDPTILEPIAQALAMGIPLRFAATLAGISEHTAYGWVTEHNRLTEAHPDWTLDQLTEELGSVAAFGQMVKRARAALVVEQVSAWREAGGKEWAKHATLLERLFPEEFGRRPATVTIDARQVHVSLGRGEDADQALTALARRLLSERTSDS